MKKRNAFTLVELLVVVAIIAILATILVPTLGRVKEIGRRTTCGVNLKGVGQALHMYAQAASNNGFLPVVSEDNADNSTVGLNRSGTSSPSNGMTRAYFQLAHDGYVAAPMFGCPSNASQMPLNYEPKNLYDFETTADGQPLSYAFQVNKIDTTAATKVITTLLDPGSLVVGADQNGAMKWDPPPTAAQASVIVDINESKNSNSPNHEREGQNVLTLGNTVKWQTTPDCGMNGDNIWIPQSASVAVTTGSPIKQADGSFDDSYLMP